jgi:hypothetical protein
MGTSLKVTLCMLFATSGLGDSVGMAQETTIHRGTISYPGFNVVFDLRGTIHFLQDRDCWALIPAGIGLPMEVDKLPAEFQAEGLAVLIAGHLDESVVSERLPPYKLIIDDISRVE